jgi:hypothetical protein
MEIPASVFSPSLDHDNPVKVFFASRLLSLGQPILFRFQSYLTKSAASSRHLVDDASRSSTPRRGLRLRHKALARVVQSGSESTDDDSLDKHVEAGLSDSSRLWPLSQKIS